MTERRCLTCVKKFFAYPRDVGVGWAKYCSRQCAYDARPSLPIAARMWSKVTKGDGCWVFGGWLDKKGYGWISHKAAHRVAWEAANGPIPNGIFVCHRCDNPSCVRPDHLFLGTQRDNMRDASSKGRFPKQKWTHCKNGHEFTPENTTRSGTRPARVCRACMKVRNADLTRHRRLKVEAAS